MIKIIYFDEPSATDYMIIKNGGVKITTEEKANEINTNAKNETYLKIGGNFSWLPFINAGAENSTDVNLKGTKQILTKNILTNVLLTDFLAKAEDDKEQIIKFENVDLYTYKTSFAFLRMFMPYLNIIKESQFPEDIPFEVSKLADALKAGKKYYEIIAKQKMSENQKYILRFNIDAFRNNYSISDIVKMNLTYYAIKVGEATEESLSIEEEFKNDYEEQIITSLENEDYLKNNENFLLPVYDIILAGV